MSKVSRPNLITAERRITMHQLSYKLGLVLLLLYSPAIDSSAYGRVDSLQRDFTFFKSILQENYPSLYRYTDKSTLDKKFDSCYATLNDNTTDLEFLKIIKFLFSAIKDGHLYCGPSPQLRQYMNNEANLFPLKIQFIGKACYLASSGYINIPAGTEIISLDHKPVNRLRTDLFKYIVSDGNIETKKYHTLNYAFPYYYLTVFGMRPDFEMVYKIKNGTQKTIKLNAVKGKDIPKDTENGEPQNLLNLKFRNDIAVLTIKTFDSAQLVESGKYFRAFLQSAFEEIKQRKIKKLIIDLRGNSGGRDLYGSLLYTYLTNREFAYYKYLATATKSLPYEQFEINNSSYNHLNPAMLDSVDVHRLLLKNTAHPNLRILQPNKSNFTGQVWFLIDGLSFSATAEFCSIAKSNHRGKFIGEETGGGYYGNTCMQIDTVLPNTKMQISFGTVKYEMAVNKAENNGRGIIPDYIITPTINDIINKKDPQFDFALKLAKGSQ
jgi:peptidase S41-like protein